MARACSRAALPIRRRAAPGTRRAAAVPEGATTAAPSSDGFSGTDGPRALEWASHRRGCRPPAPLPRADAGRRSRALIRLVGRGSQPKGGHDGRRSERTVDDTQRHAARTTLARPGPSKPLDGMARAALPRGNLRGHLRSRCSSATPWRARRRWGGKVALGRLRARESAPAVAGARATNLRGRSVLRPRRAAIGQKPATDRAGLR